MTLSGAALASKKYASWVKDSANRQWLMGSIAKSKDRINLRRIFIDHLLTSFDALVDDQADYMTLIASQGQATPPENNWATRSPTQGPEVPGPPSSLPTQNLPFDNTNWDAVSLVQSAHTGLASYTGRGYGSEVRHQ